MSQLVDCNFAIFIFHCVVASSSMLPKDSNYKDLSSSKIFDDDYFSGFFFILFLFPLNHCTIVSKFSTKWEREKKKLKVKKRKFAHKWKWTTITVFNTIYMMMIIVIIIIRFVHLIRLLSLQCWSLTFNRLELIFFVSFSFFLSFFFLFSKIIYSCNIFQKFFLYKYENINATFKSKTHTQKKNKWITRNGDVLMKEWV